MGHIVIFAAPAVGVLLLAGSARLAWRATRLRGAADAPARREPRSVVHLLADDGELREAVERASRFERGVAELLESRAVRYESLLSGSPVPELRSVAEAESGAARRTRPA